MLSAIVLAPGSGFSGIPVDRAQEAVVRSLGMLVTAAVADLVRDACIVGRPGLRLEAIADHAGCGLVENDDPRAALAAALGTARCEHVLVLDGGFAPGYGFIDEMSDWLAQVAPPAACLRRDGETPFQRIFTGLAPVVGVVAGKSNSLAVAAVGPAKLARALRARTLRTRARRLV